jgi:hypothetical protein
MPYQTGVPTDEIDLLQQLVTFLVAQGWTQDASATEGAGWRAHLHKSGLYVNLRAIRGETGSTIWPSITGGNSVGLALSLGSGYNGSNNWYDQAGVPTFLSSATLYPIGVLGLNTGNFSLAPPYSAAPFTRYHFFDTSDNIVVVLEQSPLKFRACGWGPTLTKTGGTWTGGAYFFGTNGIFAGSFGAPPDTQECPFACYDWASSDANGFVRADVDAYTGAWLAHFSASETQYGKLCTSGIAGTGDPPADVPSAKQLQFRSFSNLNAQANLIPIDIYAHRDGGGYSLLGTVPGVFATNAATYGNFSSGTVYSIGADDYMVFAGKSAATEFPGFAVLKT